MAAGDFDAMSRGQRGDLGVERLGGDDAIDQPDLSRALGADGFAGEQHLHRRLPADGPAERHARRRAEGADVDAGSGKGGGGGRDGQVAGRDELTAGRGGEAVHLGDHRLAAAW